MRVFLIFFCFIYCSAAMAASHWYSDPNLQRTLDKTTHSKQYSGNQVKLLINGIQSYAARARNLHHADVIMVKTYEIFPDKTGGHFVAQLLERAAHGARIFVQYDVTGTTSGFNELMSIWQGRRDLVPSFLKPLQNEYPNNIFLIPVNAPAHFYQAIYGLQIPIDHSKYLITWQTKPHMGSVDLIMGGMNIADKYALGGVTGGYRDTDVEVRGPVVQAVVDTFINNLEAHYEHDNNIVFKQRYHEHARLALKQLKLIQKRMLAAKEISFPYFYAGASARFVENPPHQLGDVKGRNILHLLTGVLNAVPSNRTVSLAGSQFSPPTALWHSLRQNARRGLHFNMLLNAPDSSNFQLSFIAKGARCLYKDLPMSKFKIYDWHENRALRLTSNHQKVWNFGSELEDPFIVGSANLDRHSLLYDNEGVLIVQSPLLKSQMNDMIAHDITQENVRQVDLKRLRQESWLAQAQSCAINDALHPIL